MKATILVMEQFLRNAMSALDTGSTGKARTELIKMSGFLAGYDAACRRADAVSTHDGGLQVAMRAVRRPTGLWAKKVQ